MYVSIYVCIYVSECSSLYLYHLIVLLPSTSLSSNGNTDVPIILKSSTYASQLCTGYSPILTFDIEDMDHSIQVSIYLSIYLSVYLTTLINVSYTAILLSIYLSIYLSHYLSHYLSRLLYLWGLHLMVLLDILHKVSIYLSIYLSM
jgi:hypothetical protein